VFLAARGSRATSQGTEPIEDQQLAERIKVKAGRLQLYSLLAAVLYTLTLLAASLLIQWRFNLSL
jgi:hypothetical protein